MVSTLRLVRPPCRESTQLSDPACDLFYRDYETNNKPQSETNSYLLTSKCHVFRIAMKPQNLLLGWKEVLMNVDIVISS